MKTSKISHASGPQRKSAGMAARPATVMAVALTLAAVLAPALVAAQAPDLNNPLNRNPRNRTGFADSAPVVQDPRNSTSRPTQPAASRKPDVRDTVPAPDPSRDVPATAPGGMTLPEAATVLNR
jgi:hypothetical protein